MPKLTFNSENCTGCRACELACSFYHEEVFSPSKSRIRVVRIDEEGIDVPVGCEHCDSAVCMLVCPVKAISEDKKTNAVILNPDACIGCKQCLAVCPFGAIHYDEDNRKFYKCDLCSGEPECVKWCETKAITYSDKLDELPRTKRTRRAEKTARAFSEARMTSSR
ncbi:MAG: 4Fe-4S dicluster domain-containing protein [Thermoplasmata archaeon]|nr:MAG: 4Fe-4S dicluster domain-containing protein [Thermoplasmata archaeon]